VRSVSRSADLPQGAVACSLLPLAIDPRARVRNSPNQDVDGIVAQTGRRAPEGIEKGIERVGIPMARKLAL